jgi:hypothetical protein
MSGDVCTVAGPLQAGKHGWAFGATLTDLAALGYVEEEFTLTGTASSYRLTGPAGADGRWSCEPADTAPFSTRLLVRRPTDPARFTGIAVVEWVNVTSGFDLACAEGPTLYDGFAHVVVSAQYVGVVGNAQDPLGLTHWDPERYGGLHHPGDGFSYDIFSQAARAVGPGRPAGPVDPMGGLAVEKLVATGASQSGQRLLAYINGVQPLERVFDAFLSTVSIGRAMAFDNEVVDYTTLLDPTPEQLDRAHGLRARYRDDLGVPVFVVNSECEVLSMAAVRQPDTDTFRLWEVAGASHAPAPMMAETGTMIARDLGVDGVAGGGLLNETIPPSTVEWRPTADRALLHLQRWLTDGTPPPSQEPITLDADGNVARDEHGNALGGVRLPELAVPRATYDGGGIPPHPVGLGGSTTPFDAATLATLYPSHEGYVQAVSAAARAAAAAGVITEARAHWYEEQAASS